MNNRLETAERVYIKHDDDVPSASIQLDQHGVGVYSAGCCDCGLVHDNVLIVREGFLVIVPLRNDAESEKLRAADTHEFVPAITAQPDNLANPSVPTRGGGLAPCPFCGGPAEVSHLVDENDYFVHCRDCEVQQIAIHSHEAAIELWNNRRPPYDQFRDEAGQLHTTPQTGPGPLTPTCATCGYGCHRGQERRLRDVLVCRACACPSCRPATKGGFEEALHQERAEHERTEIARCAGLQRERDLEAEIARINVRLDCGHRKVDCVDANGGCAFCGWSPRFGYSGDVYRLLREARGQLSIAKADRDAAVEAAREMRDHLVCDTSCSRECPRGDCECEGCVDARAFDAALAKLEVKP